MDVVVVEALDGCPLQIGCFERLPCLLRGSFSLLQFLLAPRGRSVCLGSSILDYRSFIPGL